MTAKNNILKQIEMEKNQIDNEVALWMIKFTALLLALGVTYKLLVR